MRLAILLHLAATAAIAAALPAYAQSMIAAAPEDRRSLAVTIYNEDLALVRDVRRIDLSPGETALEFAGVSAKIRPESAILQAPDAQVIAQNFDFDLLTPQALVEKAVGTTVRLYRPHPTTGEDRVEQARVLAANDGVILEIGGRIEILDRLPGRIVFDDLPETLRAEPTLSMDLAVADEGTRDVTLSYLTSGLSWKADYVGVLVAGEATLDLTGWITLTNTSGTAFENATTQLVAGEVAQVRDQPDRPRPELIVRAMRAQADVAEETVLDFHLYTLPRPTSVADNQTKQVAFLDAPEVSVKKSYRYSAFGFSTADEPEPVSVFLGFANDDEAGLGEPLPKGILRVYTADSAGRMQFVGEDRVAHTPEGREVQARLGAAFDVTVTPTQRDRTQISRGRDQNIYEATQRYGFENAKDEAVTVRLEQRMPGRDWSILKESQAHSEATADRVIWQVEVPARGEAALEFTARLEQ